MRPFSLFAIILLAALCFVAGYTIGKKDARIHALTSPIPSKSEESSLTPVVETTAFPPDASARSDLKMETPVFKQAEPYEETDFALRAQQSTINLTDNNNRSMQGTFLAVFQEYVQVRRQVDGLVVDVPFAMLCPEDRAFAAYLLKNKTANEPSSLKDSDRIWAEIFKGL